MNLFFRDFAKTIKRPFSVRYNPYTQSVDVLKDTASINNVVEELRHELDIIGDALSRLNKQLGVWKTKRFPANRPLLRVPVHLFCHSISLSKSCMAWKPTKRSQILVSVYIISLALVWLNTWINKGCAKCLQEEFLYFKWDFYLIRWYLCKVTTMVLVQLRLHIMWPLVCCAKLMSAKYIGGFSLHLCHLFQTGTL